MKNKADIKNLFRHFKEEEEGAVLVIVAVSMVILMGITALAVDLGMIYHQKSKLQAACDSAAIAAAYKLPDTAQATLTAREYITKNGFQAQAVAVTFPNGDNKSVKVVSAQQQTAYLATIFGLNTINYACTSNAAQVSNQLTDKAFSYCIFSGNQYPAQPSFSVRTQNICVLSGLTNRVWGDVHGNYNLDANTSTIAETGEAVGTVTGVNIADKKPGSAFIAMPDFSSYKPQIKAAAQAAGQYYTGNFSKANKTSVNLIYPLYVEGNANLSDISFSGAGCIYVQGKITVTGSATNYLAGSSICIYSGKTSAYKSDYAIDFAGSAKNIKGMLYAPYGSILVSGSNYTFSGAIVGCAVDISGSGKNFYNVDVSNSFPYNTTMKITLTKSD